MVRTTKGYLRHPPTYQYVPQKPEPEPRAMSQPPVDIFQMFDKIEDGTGLLRAVFEKSIAGVAVIGDDFRIEYVNDVACGIVGMPRAELLGQDFRKFLHPEAVSTVETRYISRRANLEPPEMYEIRVRRRSGELRTLLIKTAMVRGDAGTAKTVAYFLDLTEEKERAIRLRETENRHQTLVEAMGEGLGVIDPNGDIEYANPALCEMSGYEQTELVGRHAKDFIGMSEETVAARLSARRQGRTEHYEAYVSTKAGTCLQVAVSAAPLYSGAGAFIGSIAIVSDISELKKAEAALKRSEGRERAAREKALLYLDVMAHDIGNQLQVLRSSLELLETAAEGAPKAYLMDSILLSLDRCGSIISKARDIERIMSLPLTSVDLNQTLLHSVTMERSRFRDTTIQITNDVPQAEVRADDFLQKLFSIVIENAAIHNPRNDKQVFVGVESRSDGFLVTVGDNGPGIPDGIKGNLFDPTRRPGGFGLLVARHIVEKYGGKLTFADRVQGSPEQGAEFRIWLPAAGAAGPE